jgi:MGT family glycosyltransferase
VIWEATELLRETVLDWLARRVARFLFVVPPMVGHVNPTLSVAAELERRGHEVAWAGHRSVAGELLPEGARLFDLERPGEREEFLRVAARALELRGPEALQFLWEAALIPLARAMLPGVERAIDAYRPNVLCVDRQAFAGALLARRRGITWATSATTSTDRRESIGSLHAVYRWTEERLAELQRELGLEPLALVEESPRLVLVFTSLELVGTANPDPEVYQFVGPSLGHRASRDRESFPWHELRDVPRVLVSLGTLNPGRGARFFRAVAEALGGLELQVILVAPEAYGPFPPNFLARGWVPQIELLPHVRAVVCHAGQNTVSESLAHGLPLVVVPIKDDQPIVAHQVTRCGAGLRLPFARPRPAAIREAVERVLGEPGFRSAAERIRRSFVEAGGARRAATCLERLASRSGSGAGDLTARGLGGT